MKKRTGGGGEREQVANALVVNLKHTHRETRALSGVRWKEARARVWSARDRRRLASGTVREWHPAEQRILARAHVRLFDAVEDAFEGERNEAQLLHHVTRERQRLPSTSLAQQRDTHIKASNMELNQRRNMTLE